MKSNTSSSEFDDFYNEFKDVVPLKNTNQVITIQNGDTLAKQLKRKAIEADLQRINNYLTVESVEPVDPYDHLSFKQDGIQDGVYKNLRLGKYKIDAVLNLQNLKFEQARSSVFTNIINNHQKGNRTILLKHGLGLHSKPFAGFLKSYVNRWLTQMPEVIAYHTALMRHGGNSAVYVLLKKNQQQKSHNRELYQSR